MKIKMERSSASQGNQIQTYIDNIMKKKEEKKEKNISEITHADIEKLEFMYPFLTPEDFMKKLIRIQTQEYPNSKQLQNLCYLGLGKQLVKEKSSSYNRQVSRVNLHIRDYMVNNVQNHLQKLQEANPNCVYVIIKSKGLAFDPMTVPQPLQQLIQQSKYHQIMRQVNHIIQKKICEHKNRPEEPDNTVRFIIALITLFVILFIFYRKYSYDSLLIILGLVKSFALIILLVFGIHYYRAQRKQFSVIDTICQQIKSYLDFVNGNQTNNLQWKIGLDFFWIEIHLLNNKEDIFFQNKIKNQFNEEKQCIKRMIRTSIKKKVI